MRVAAVQFDIVWEDKAANHRRLEAMLDEADLARGTLVVLPELADTGFSFNLDQIVDDRSAAWAAEIARSRGVWIQMGYAMRGNDGRGRNLATLIDPDGRITGTYEKLHPFSYGKESLHYAGGDRIVLRRVQDAVVCPFICYDLRFPEVWRLGMRAGAEVFAIGANWPDARQHHWRQLLIARAIENQAYVVAVNRVGRDPHLGYAGGSIIVSPMGDVLAEAGTDPAIIRADLDLDALRAWRRDFPASADIRSATLGSMDVDSMI